MIKPTDAWALARVLAGISVNGELDVLDEPWKGMGAHLAGLPVADRSGVWDTMLIARLDRDGLIMALSEVDPNGPAPAPVNIRPAHLGDLAQGCGRFIWDCFLVRGHLNLLSSNPKIGKTRVMLDIARRIWQRELA
jgi:hypothetical protein